MTLKVFKAAWCGPCKALTPKLEELKAEGHDIEFIDVDKDPEQTQKFGIRGVPAMIKVVKEDVKGTLMGDQSKDKILELIGV